MSISEAIEILEYYNIWRRGEVDVMKYSSKELGESIDIILEQFKNINKSVEKKIEFEIFKLYNLDFNDLKIKSRLLKFRLPRQIAMYLLKSKTDLTQSEIGSIFNMSDSIVANNYKVISEEIKWNQKLKLQIDNIEEELNKH